MAMRGSVLMPGMAAKILICVDKTVGHDLEGRLLNPYMPRPVEFGSCYELMQRLEGFFDNISFPFSYFQHRDFRPKDKQAGYIKNKKGVRQYMSEDIFTSESGKKATFVVHVQFRQNATWQGTITWTEEKKTQRFRSVLEMLKLMGSAVDPDDAPDFYADGES